MNSYKNDRNIVRKNYAINYYQLLVHNTYPDEIINWLRCATIETLLLPNLQNQIVY